MLCSDILRFADLLLENKVRVNRINLSKGKQNLFKSARTGLFPSCISTLPDQKKLEILQLFIIGSQVQTGTETWYRKPMRGFNFVPIRSDPMLIFLSGNRPLAGDYCTSKTNNDAIFPYHFKSSFK